MGVLNTLAGLLVIYAAKWLLQWSDIAANAAGYAVGLLISFSINSRWTFRYQGAFASAFPRFVAVTLVAYGMNLLIVLVAIHHLHVNDYLAQALGIAPYTVVSYLASKYLVFRPARSRNE